MGRGRPAEFDREEVLEKAMNVFWSRGFESASLDDLTQAMEIGRQSLYRAFGGKKELFLEALDRYFQMRRRETLQFLKGEAPSLDNLVRMFEMLERRERKERRGCMIGNSAAGFGSRDPALAALLRQHLRSLRDGFERFLAAVQRQGEVSPQADTMQLAGLITSVLQGLAVQSRVETDRQSLLRTVAHLVMLLKKA